jgi:hypothetical protein
MSNKEGDRALVNGEPCVRVSIPIKNPESLLNYKGNITNDLCSWCPNLPNYSSAIDGCYSSCGSGFVWLNETSYVELQLIK